MEKTISRRVYDDDIFAQLEGLHPVLRRIFASRGVASTQDLEKGLEKLLPYTSLKGIQQAAECLYQALLTQKRILIVGDFDADGATSTALAVTALRTMGAKSVNFIVPNRFEYGYGLTPEIIAAAADLHPELIITVDNGISSVDGVEAANAQGIQVIITDHHLPGDELPKAAAIVNPNQVGCEFPSKNLAGVGVIFYVMLALRAKLRAEAWFEQQNIDPPNLAELLDLVALGTVADVVPLDHNNRVLVHQGIGRIRAGKVRPGIQALLEVGKRKLPRVCAQDLSFAVAPRLNAAGRLDDMALGIECLLSQTEFDAKQRAIQLDTLNLERKSIEADMQTQAMRAVEKLQLNTEVNNLPYSLCLYQPSWHQGIVGIVAGRVKERFHRPVIAFAKVDEENLKGSARSIPGLHIRDTLDAVAKANPDLMSKFGGHAMAAGLTLKESLFKEFTQEFEKQVRATLSEQDLEEIIHSDGELAINEFNMNLALALRDAGPWGQSFPEPVFDGEFKIVQQHLVGAKHLKLLLAVPGADRIVDGIYFNANLNVWPNHRCDKVRIAYRLDVNEYRGQSNIQLMIDYIEALS